MKICKEVYHTSPEKGNSASQNYWYYGYKFHGVCSISGVFTCFDLTKANVHDIHYLKDVKHQLSDCMVIGDKAYLSKEMQLNLFDTANIRLETPMRINQKNYIAPSRSLKKVRKRIETLFSQLCDQFMIRRNYARSFEGFKTRIHVKITALTVVQYINRFIFKRNINNVKIQIC